MDYKLGQLKLKPSSKTLAVLNSPKLNVKDKGIGPRIYGSTEVSRERLKLFYMYSEAIKQVESLSVKGGLAC